MQLGRTGHSILYDMDLSLIDKQRSMVGSDSELYSSGGSDPRTPSTGGSRDFRVADIVSTWDSPAGVTGLLATFS